MGATKLNNIREIKRQVTVVTFLEILKRLSLEHSIQISFIWNNNNKRQKSTMRRREAFSTSSSSSSASTLPQPAAARRTTTRRNMSPHRHSAPAIITDLSSSSCPSLNYDHHQIQHHQHQNNNLSTPIQLHRNATIATSSPCHHHESMRNNNNNNKRSNDSFSHDSYSYSHYDDDHNSFVWWKVMLCVGLAILPWLPSQFDGKRSKIANLKEEMDTLIKDQRSIVKDLDKLTENVKDIKFVNEVTLIDNGKLFQQLSSDDDNNNNNRNRNNGNGVGGGIGGGYKIPSKTNLDYFNNANQEYLQEEDSEENYLFRIDQLEKYIQEMSVKRIQKRYGLDPSTSGPLKVKVTLEEDSSSDNTIIAKTNKETHTWRQVQQQQNTKRDESYFIIELATLQEMPYSVDHFLKMVELKLWEGLSLTHNLSKSNGKGRNKIVDDSLLVASPSNPYYMSSSSSSNNMNFIENAVMDYEMYTWSQHKFQNANLTQMEFTEHSETYPPPHKSLKYSVSFRGRPGGPDWYINLSDDDYSHVVMMDDHLDEGSSLPIPSSTPTSNPPSSYSSTSTRRNKKDNKQYHHSHDSTFGFVVEGREVLDRFLKDKRRREKTGSKENGFGIEQVLKFKTLEVIQ